MKNTFLFFGQVHHTGYVFFLWVGLLSIFTLGTSLAQTPDTTRQRPVIRPGVPAPTDTLTPEMARDNAAFLVDSLNTDADSVAI
ncbi:MAG TPA: hypothetical protein VGB67_03440, partial [Fibrella sp.]